MIYCTVVKISQCVDELKTEQCFETQLDLLIEYMAIGRFEGRSAYD